MRIGSSRNQITINMNDLHSDGNQSTRIVEAFPILENTPLYDALKKNAIPLVWEVFGSNGECGPRGFKVLLDKVWNTHTKSKEYGEVSFMDAMLYLEWEAYSVKQFVDYFGVLRDTEEACELAAERWIELMKDVDMSSDLSQSDRVSVSMKKGILKRYDDSVFEKIKKNIEKLYKDYYTNRNKDYIRPRLPRVDDEPNEYLYLAGAGSGIEKQDLRLLLFPKTYVAVDVIDGAVLYKSNDGAWKEE